MNNSLAKKRVQILPDHPDWLRECGVNLGHVGKTGHVDERDPFLFLITGRGATNGFWVWLDGDTEFPRCVPGPCLKVLD